MKKFSFIFAGTSHLSLKVLNFLLNQKELELKALLSQRDSPRGRGLKTRMSPVKEFAISKGIAVKTPKNLQNLDFLKEIQKYQADFCFVCAYGQIFPQAYLNLFPKGCLNLHFSSLPSWRGAAPIQRAIMAGDLKTGVCLQIMQETLDTGDIVSSQSFPITDLDNSETLFEKSLKASSKMIEKDLILYLKDQIKPKPQDSSKASYAVKIKKEEALINWKEPAWKIHNKIRALFLGPQAFFFFKGKRVKVYRSKPVSQKFPDFASGSICLLAKDKLAVACGSHALSLLEVQKEGKKRQAISEFLKSHNLKLKDTFGEG